MFSIKGGIAVLARFFRRKFEKRLFFGVMKIGVILRVHKLVFMRDSPKKPPNKSGSIFGHMSGNEQLPSSAAPRYFPKC